MRRINEPENINLESPHFLTERQKLFVIEYVQNGNNPTLAAKYAGFQGDDSELQSIARGLLSWAHVRKYLLEKERMHRKRMDITEDRIINELSLIAFADPIDFCDSDGNFLPLHRLPERIRRALSSVGMGEFNLSAKEKALDKLCKIKGMFKADKKQEGDSNDLNLNLKITRDDLEERIKLLEEGSRVVVPKAD